MCLTDRHAVTIARETIARESLSDDEVRADRLLGLQGLSAGGFVSIDQSVKLRSRTLSRKKPVVSRKPAVVPVKHRSKSARIKQFEAVRDSHRSKVVELRSAGLPWNQIAMAIGVSRPAVQKWSRLWGIR